MLKARVSLRLKMKALLTLKACTFKARISQLFKIGAL